MDNGREPQNWYESFLKRIRPYQFNWIGRTREGVSRWTGAPKGPSERACKNLMGYGIAMSLVGLIAAGALLIGLHASAPLGLLALIGAIHGLVFTILGLWLRKMHRTLARLKTVEELAEEFASTPETVQRLAEVRGIRARININDDNLYDPEEFIASRSLLRAASAPYTSETLLRAAEPTTMQPGCETLLRPVEPITVGLTPIQQLYYSAGQGTDETEEVIQTLHH